MKLYHYSFTRDILEEGLEPLMKHNDTKIINKMISNRHGDCFGRDYCIFFNKDFRDIGDVNVSANINDLDNSSLFIADQDIADAIYSNWYRGNDCDNLIDRYIESIKKFSDYNNEYSNPEIFYTDYISPDLLTVIES